MSTNKRGTNSMLHNLYKKPIKDKGMNQPQYPDFANNFFHQADLLHLPDDDGYRYALVVVDVGSRMTDARPLKTKRPAEILKAFKTIYKGKYLKHPTNVIGFDSGAEFKGVVKDYFENKLNVKIKLAKPDRHRQQAIVERKNRDIGKYIFMRMTMEELQTGEISRQWVDFLPTVIERINNRTKKTRKRTLHQKVKLEYRCDGDACNLLEQGTKVRVALDAPRNVHDNKKLHGAFRESDIRFDPKVRTIKGTMLAPGVTPTYLLDDGKNGTDYNVSYTKNQLQVIPKNEKAPTEKDIMGQKENKIAKWHVKELLERKKIKGRIYFKVSWKGYKKTTYEPRTNLIKDIPNVVLSFEKNHNTKK